MEERVRQILTDLERVRENLLALSDDIWLSIDHNDQDALLEGVEFKRIYNEKMAQLNSTATGLSALIQKFTDVPLEQPITGGPHRNGTTENERIIRELNRETQHTLDEDFSYKRPYGFVLDGQAYQEILTWRGLYELLGRQLSIKDGARFRDLPNNPHFISKRGNKSFANSPADLRFPLEIAAGVYAEGNLSANNIRDNIKHLLQEFGIDPQTFVIYLREDRDALADTQV
ncbi:MAG: hypothetical protein H0X37_11140 [Herpetosiphonaceae bacterium]|nr:hypothetical protein [Herpetosiphonaceae bacterium]